MMREVPLEELLRCFHLRGPWARRPKRDLSFSTARDSTRRLRRCSSCCLRSLASRTSGRLLYSLFANKRSASYGSVSIDVSQRDMCPCL